MSGVHHAFGRPTWHELRTTNVTKARGFYGGLFGWSFKSEKLEGFDSHTLIVTSTGRTIGGMWDMKVTEPGWVTYVSVDDVDVAANAALADGGSLIRGPGEIPDTGRFAVIADPFGAAIIAFKNRGGDPVPAVPKPGEFCWETLATPNAARAREFYGKIFGWTTQSGPGGHIPVFAVGDKAEDQIADVQETTRFPSQWFTYVAIEEVENSRARATELGGQIIAPLIEVPTIGRICIIKDPEGATLGLFERARS